MIGKTISHYRIIEKLGEGGMGVVYKAEDTKLKRTVALKFLPPELTQNEEAKERFVHEAQAAGTLSHANIATIYGIDEHEGNTFIAMEYIEGQTLKEKIKKGPLKLKETITIAKQIAEGLSAAHEKSIVHRDIKSANIMLKEKNQVKIMDFGLAKITTGSMVTKAGTTLGTIAYMSPEQTQGEPVDHRSDIFSFGVVLYEMIAGQLPFTGEYEQAIIYSILNEDPEPLTAIRTGVPMELERIVNKLFAKEPEDRYQNIIELPVDLKAIDLSSSSTSQISRRAVSGSVIQQLAVRQKKIPWKIVAPLLIITALIFSIVGWLLKPQAVPEPKPVSMFPYYFLPGEEMWTDRLAISPDGTKIVYGAATGGVDKLYLRKIGQLEATPIDNTEGAIRPFFSPDSRELCFFADNKLKKILIDGGPAQTLCDLSSTDTEANLHCGTWGDDGTIIFVRDGSDLLQFSASGGIPEVILTLDSGKIPIYYRFPEMLPGSKAVLYTAWEGGIYDEANISVLSLETGETETLITGGTNSLYSPTGHILFGRSGSCWAVEFDAEQLKIIGQEVPVQEGVYITSELFGGAMHFRVSTNGTLVYIPGAEEAEDQTLVLVDRHGVETPLTDIQRSYGYPCFSPDGKRVALHILEDNITNIWIHDVARNTQIPLTSEGSINRFSNWSPDGKKVTFQSNRSGVINIYWKRADGIGEAELVFGSANSQFGGTWSDDGTVFAFCEIGITKRREDIWVYTTRDSTATPFLNTPNREYSPAISPDGNWIAYISDKTGQSQVYIAPYPGPGSEEPISTQGGEQVVWAPDGRELFYRKDNKVMAVSVETRPSLKLGMPEQLFEKPYPYYESNSNITSYDIHPDGDHFLMIKSVECESVPDQINIVLNWFEVLKEKMALAQE